MAALPSMRSWPSHTNTNRSQPDEEDPLLRHPSHNRPYGGFNSSTSSLTNALNPPQDPERLRREAEALERICADTADKLIDISQNFGASKIDSDFDRLFSEAFSPGLMTGPMATRIAQEGDEEHDDGEDQQVPTMPESPDIAKATNEQEWLRAVLSAAKKHQDKSGNEAGVKNWDAGFVAEIDQPLVHQFDGS